MIGTFVFDSFSTIHFMPSITISNLKDQNDIDVCLLIALFLNAKFIILQIQIYYYCQAHTNKNSFLKNSYYIIINSVLLNKMSSTYLKKNTVKYVTQHWQIQDEQQKKY